VDLEALESQELPEPLQAMPAAEQKALIAETGRRREELKRQIKDLADQRAA
jgi:cell division protein FtsB